MKRKNSQDFDFRISIEKSIKVARQRIINILKEVEVPITKNQIKKDCYIHDYSKGIDIFSLAIDYMLRNNEIKIIQVNNLFYYILAENFDEDSMGALKICLLNKYHKRPFHQYNFNDEEIRFVIANKKMKLLELTNLFNCIFREEPLPVVVITGLKQRIRQGTAKKIITREEFKSLGSKRLDYEWSEK
jgi:hypothetical protein